MEIVEKNNTGKIGATGVILLAAGLALLCWSLWMLPAEPAYGFPWAFTLAVISLVPVAAGGWCLAAMAMRQKNPSHRYGSDDSGGGGVVFALWVIVAGAMLLGFNSGLLPMEWRRVFFSWQMLLLLGAMTEYARGKFVWATVLMAVGGYFIVRRLAPIYPDIASSGMEIAFWPILLIIAGVLILGGIILRPRYKRCGGHCHGRRKGDKSDDGYTSKASGVIDITTVFGGSEQVYLDPVFRGGKISTVFGGVKLDLRRTELSEGETWLQVESVFGGVEIDAPEEWIIEIRNESIFGGFADKRLPPMNGYTQGRKLIIKASNVFGGGDIK